MSMQPSFRSMMYATFALAILPALVACSSGNDGQEGVENRVKPVAVFEQPAHATEAGAEGDAAVTAGETASEDAAAAVEPVAAAAAEAVAPVAVAAGRDGATVYNQVCRTCHEVGVAGAPKKGDKAAWAPRIATGKEALYTSALKGKGAMASKGGNPSLSDDEVKGAVDYLVSLAQ